MYAFILVGRSVWLTPSAFSFFAYLVRAFFRRGFFFFSSLPVPLPAEADLLPVDALLAIKSSKVELQMRSGTETERNIRRGACQTDNWGACVESGRGSQYGPPPSAMGRRQAVRHRILIPAYGGSNPPAPAS